MSFHLGSSTPPSDPLIECSEKANDAVGDLVVLTRAWTHARWGATPLPPIGLIPAMRPLMKASPVTILADGSVAKSHRALFHEDLSIVSGHLGNLLSGRAPEAATKRGHESVRKKYDSPDTRASLADLSYSE